MRRMREENSVREEKKPDKGIRYKGKSGCEERRQGKASN